MIRASLLWMLCKICYALTIHSIKLSKEDQEDKFLMFTVPEFHVGDKVLVRSHTRDVWDPKYDTAYCVV